MSEEKSRTTNEIVSHSATQDFELGGGTIPPTPTPPPTPPKKSKPPVDPVARKKAIVGCIGFGGGLMIVFMILALIFIAQGDQETNPIARLLGLNQAVFINGLITLVHLGFILAALSTFVVTMIGLFRASMAKREDKITKKAGIRLAATAGGAFMIILIVWGFMYFYLDSKRIFTRNEVAYGIVTEPEDTFNLTVPIEIRFDGSRLPIDSKKYQIIAYKWEFGDGGTGTKQIETHTYKSKGKAGRYEVELTVTLRDKKTKEESEEVFKKTITISDEAIAALFDADPRSGEVPLKVKFNAKDSLDPDGEIVSYEWDLDEDGEFDDAEGVEIEQTFKKVGIHTVALRVTGKGGDFAVEEKEITVKEKVLPEAVITIVDNPASFIKGTQYVFKADESTSPNGTIKSYQWNFGDGSQPKTTKTVNYVFSQEGTYEVTLTVTDETGKQGETTKKIQVGAAQGAPDAKITANPAISNGKIVGKVPLSVTFDASSSTDSDKNIVEYEWDFEGDKKTDTYGEKATHTFTKEGIYTTTVLVIDASGNKDTAAVTVEVQAQGIQAVLSVNKVEGNVPLTVTFDASASTHTNGKITSYKWDFGDGTTPKLGSALISHKYTTIGTYTAKVTVIGADSTMSTVSQLITVREVPLQACITPTLKKGSAPLTVTFDPGCSTGTITNYFWDFGDGTTTAQLKPAHVFKKAGTYPVTLEITDSDNTVSETTLQIEVTN